MDTSSGIIILNGTIIIILLSIYIMLYLVRDSMCVITKLLSYEEIINVYDGYEFKTNDARYSAEVIIGFKLNDLMNIASGKRASILTDPSKTKDVAVLDKQLTDMKLINTDIKKYRDDVIYHILTTDIVGRFPAFVIMTNDPNYIPTLIDYNQSTKKFNHTSTMAKKLISKYLPQYPTNDEVSDETLYHYLTNQ